jgi:putative NADPH-quinone reductase
MRVLLVQAHPMEDSYNRALRDRMVAELSRRHEVDVLDLYAEDFNPVMSREERQGYHTIPHNIEPVRRYVERLMAAQALVFCYPAWSFGPPAILKGWLDRVLLPGVAFHLLPEGKVAGGLGHLQKLGAVVTFGQTWLRVTLMGNYPRKLVTRYLHKNIGMEKPVTFCAHYNMNASTPSTRAAFLEQVGRKMARF